MPGKHGSLWAYIRAYHQWGGRPPIPDTAEATRGGMRPNRHSAPVAIAVLLVAALPVVFVVTRLGLPTSDEPLVLSSFAVLWLGLGFMVQMMLGNPLLDWYENIPRHGVVDNAKPGVPAPEVLE